MPVAFLILGAVLVLVAIRGTHTDLASQLKSDFTGSGQGGFLIWLAAIVAVGALGYSSVMRTPARMLLGLVVLGMVVSNQGVFAQLKSAFQSPPQPSTPPVQAELQQLPAGIPVQQIGGGGASSSGGAAGTAGQAASAVGSIFKAIPFIVG